MCVCVYFVVLCVGGSVLVNGVFFDFTTHLMGIKKKPVNIIVQLWG